MLKYLIFLFLCLLHIFVWAFVLLAFMKKDWAKFNLFILIPFLYILHILPFHILVKSKSILYPEDSQTRCDIIESFLIIPKLFLSLQKYLEESCFMSPISPQGMLIFGALSSSYRLLIYGN
jgi:hypothetical protein